MLTSLVPLVGAAVLLVQLGVTAWRLRPGVAVAQAGGAREAGGGGGASQAKRLRMFTRSGLLGLMATSVFAFGLVRLYFPLTGMLTVVWVVAVVLMGFVAFRVVQLWPAREREPVGRVSAVARLVVYAFVLVFLWFAPRIL